VILARVVFSLPESGTLINPHRSSEASVMQANMHSPTSAGLAGADTGDMFVPRLDWHELAESGHFVQFYETDHFLLHALSDFIGTGLRAGEAAIVVATPDHCASLAEQLQAAGLDVRSAQESGQYVVLDAAELLTRFMVDGMPEPARFAKLFGGLVTQAALGGRPVRVFGEMVALLWAEGNHAGTVRLEELWNGLRETHPFILFCAYPITGLDGDPLAPPFSDVCLAHAHLIPAESYTALPGADERARAIIGLQQKARLLEQELATRAQSLAREQAARAEAEHANRLKDEFLATVSHELRTPLTTIIAWTQRLRKSAPSEATLARGLELIERNAKAQARLVEDILDVSQVITGKLQLDVGPVDAIAVISAAVDMVQPAADSKGIQLAMMLDPAARRIAGDATRLQQVLWNLLSNAIKFTPPGGRVEVRLERASADVEISVSDTGEGIVAEALPFIFDHFRQADSTSTRRHGGLGLGLAIVRHLVALHGGTIRAESAGAGQGATFTLCLPRTAEPAPA
jgi:signal transduction histidine kinase